MSHEQGSIRQFMFSCRSTRSAKPVARERSTRESPAFRVLVAQLTDHLSALCHAKRAVCDAVAVSEREKTLEMGSAQSALIEMGGRLGFLEQSRCAPNRYSVSYKRWAPRCLTRANVARFDRSFRRAECFIFRAGSFAGASPAPGSFRPVGSSPGQAGISWQFSVHLEWAGLG